MSALLKTDESIPKQRFNQRAWSILSIYLQGHIGEIHHAVGKNYEYLRFLMPMSAERHRGKGGHHKYMSPEDVPPKVVEDNLFFWKTLLSKVDYAWFVQNHYV